MNSLQTVVRSYGPKSRRLDPAEGCLKVEYYGSSETVQSLFGKDIAYTITVDKMDKRFSTTPKDGASLISSNDWKRVKSAFVLK